MDEIRVSEQGLQRTLFYVVLVSASILLSLLLLFTPYYIPFAIAIGIILIIISVKFPLVALLLYIGVITLRPGEVLNIPYLAKIAAGACLLGWIGKFLKTRKPVPMIPLTKTMLFFFLSITASVAT